MHINFLAARGITAAKCLSIRRTPAAVNKQNNNSEYSMHGFLKALSYVIALLVLIAIFYAGYTSVKYWAGIGV